MNGKIEVDAPLFIKADEVYSDRWLHKDEQFIKQKNWNVNLPEEREFKNGYSITTDKENTAYSIDELINLLNFLHNAYYQSQKELFDLKVEMLDDQLAEYATSNKERADAWQEEFGMSEREAKRKAGWVHWSLYSE